MAVSEFELIARYFSGVGDSSDVAVSTGDDCAIMRVLPDERMVISVDTAVESVHFLPDTDPKDLAWRAVAVAASDLAAMGARPLGMTIALTLPEADENWLAAFSQGLRSVSEALCLPLVGGDTTRGFLTVTVHVLGAVPSSKALLRSGAQPGDRVVVSGYLGDGAGALAMMTGNWHVDVPYRDYLQQRFLRPQPRLELGRQILDSATSAIDISDGLLADAGHICRASAVGMILDKEALPLSEALTTHSHKAQVLQWALTGGDDYELCFTLPAHVPVPEACTVIGEVVAGDSVICEGAEDVRPGYQHF
ncbi:MAG: thiamine-phosphate kinase [Gammaproteobacteria bacterium]|nr:MAG: thiamine-phosphate kinase [Gammaproteobacteria bacterium]